MASWTTEAWIWFEFAAEWTIRVGALLYIPRKRSPVVARSWLLLFFFFPWLGVISYALVGRVSLPKKRLRLLREFRERMQPVEERLSARGLDFSATIPDRLNAVETLASNLGHLATTSGNAVEVLIDYRGLIARLASDIDAARDHAHLAFYIFTLDETTEPVIRALESAARRGVRCRVLMDDVGSDEWIDDLGARFDASGIEWREMYPVRLWSGRGARVDLRNHRKLAVIDGRVGYTGSQNLMDDVIDDDFRREELMIRVAGPVVLQLQYVFTRDWYAETEQALVHESIFPSPERAGDLVIQALPSGPGCPVESNQRLFVSMLHMAQSRVIITTPYFIPDETFLQAIETAVLKGVDVTLIMAERSDASLVNLAQRSYYGILLASGARVLLYRRGFLHAKHMIVDDDLAVIGTSNIDVRSFALNAELSLLFYGPTMNKVLDTVVSGYTTHCVELTPETWRGRRWGERTAQNIARLFSPLL